MNRGMEKYKVVRVLNSGSFGTAILVSNKSSGSLHVIKDIDISKLSKKERETTLQEVRILEALRHPNIVAFDEAFTQDGSLKIVMQYCDGGDLLGLVKSQCGRLLEENYVLDIFVQLALALKHVHDRKIIHRDIKTENIFLSSHKRVVKLGDFGIAKVLESTMQQARTAIGTPYYLSPEICQGKLYNFKSDIWSLGVVLYELCALRCPFAGANMKGLMLCISKGTYSPIPASFSSEIRKLIADMLNLNAKLRPSINDLLRRPILQQRISKLIEGSVLRQEFSHTVLHGQHYSKSKCPDTSPSPSPADAPAPAAEADKQTAAALKHGGRVADAAVGSSAQPKPAADAKAAFSSKPHVNHAEREKFDRDAAALDKIEREKREKEVARILAEKRRAEENAECEKRERAAAAADKAERERQDRQLAKILADRREIEAKMERDKRDRELARHREFHQQRIEKQAEAAVAAACCLDRAQEDRAKQKKQQLLALEDFRQKQAKQWLGGAALPAPCAPAPPDQCMIRKDVAAGAVRDADVAAARRLWSARPSTPNSVDQVKARGAAQKIEEQQKYEQALAIARKQAYLERLAAEDRRQRELNCAFQDAKPLDKKTPAMEANAAAMAVAESAPADARERPQLVSPDPRSAFEERRIDCVKPPSAIPEIACAPVSVVAECEVAQGVGAQSEAASPESPEPSDLQMSEAEQQEEQSLREIVGELMHLTLDPSSNQDEEEEEEEDESESSSVFEKIEGLRLKLESLLGTQSFLQLYELARVCQDGSSGKLEAKIDAINSQDSDLVFNSLVQLLNFESEVYCS